jgi:hypothetical protein
MAKVQELLTNEEMEQWCYRSKSLGQAAKHSKTRSRRRRADRGEWLQASVPVLHGPAENAPWVERLRHKIHPPQQHSFEPNHQSVDIPLAFLYTKIKGFLSDVALTTLSAAIYGTHLSPYIARSSVASRSTREISVNAAQFTFSERWAGMLWPDRERNRAAAAAGGRGCERRIAPLAAPQPHAPVPAARQA